MSLALDATLVAELIDRVSGSVLGPHDLGYDEARAVHNGLVDRKPALIVRCRGTNDVVAALAFARRARLEVSVRGGGHNVAGRAVTEGGLMIDLSEMKRIAVDPGGATVVAEGGVTWGELNEAAAAHRLAVTGGAVSGTGIAGYTLGGGLGWLMAKFGLASDNLLAVELVTAEATFSTPTTAPTRICSGRSAAAAATSASRRHSRTGSTRSGRSSAASSPIRSRRRRTCSASTATPSPTPPTT
jgi:FAD/FMN-containing dehydrogenase